MLRLFFSLNGMNTDGMIMNDDAKTKGEEP